MDAHADMPIRDVLLEDCDVTIDRWTQYPGEAFDNRPTRANDPMLEPGGLEKHDTPAFFLRNVNGATLRRCTAHWGGHLQSYFSCALEARNVSNLKIEHFQGKAAHEGVRAMSVEGK